MPAIEEDDKVDRRTVAFKQAVEEAAERKNADLQKQIDALRELLTAERPPQAVPVIQGAPPADVVAYLRPVFESLGMTMAEISNQGVGPKPIPLEVIREREEANREMLARIKLAKERKETPRYRVTGIIVPDHGNGMGIGMVKPYWRDKDHVDQPTEVTFIGIPNKSLAPLNEVAKEIHTLFLRSIGSPLGKIESVGTEVQVDGIAPPEVKRHAAREFDVDPGGGMHVLYRGQQRGQQRHVRILGTVADPAVISN